MSSGTETGTNEGKSRGGEDQDGEEKGDVCRDRSELIGRSYNDRGVKEPQELINQMTLKGVFRWCWLGRLVGRLWQALEHMYNLNQKRTHFTLRNDMRLEGPVGNIIKDWTSRLDVALQRLPVGIAKSV